MGFLLQPEAGHFNPKSQDKNSFGLTVALLAVLIWAPSRKHRETVIHLPVVLSD